MTWQEDTARALDTSVRVAALDFQPASTRRTIPSVPQDQLGSNIPHTRYTLRECKPHERKLYLADEDTKSAVQQQATRAEQRSRNPRDADIYRLIEAMRTLADISAMPEAQEAIEEVEQQYANLDAEITSMKAQMATREAAERASSAKAQAERGAAAKTALILEEEKKKVSLLEQIVKERQAETDMLVIELEGVRIRREQEDQVNSMQVTLDSMPIPEDVEGQEAIAKLQDLLLKRKREMEELEREEEAMDLEDSVATMTSSADAGRLSSGLITRDFAPPLPSSRHAGKIKLKIRKRLKENPSSPSSSRQDEAGSVEKSGRLLDEIKERLKACVDISSARYESRLGQDILRYAHETLVDVVSNEGRLEDAGEGEGAPGSGMVIEPIPTPNSMLAALVLQTIALADGATLPLAQLKHEISTYASKRGWSATQAVQSVYTLVANQLIDIDRSSKENWVRLQ